MASYQLIDPKEGNIIRVKMRNNLHHYGIYVSDMEVIQYGLAKDAFGPKENVKVLVSTIQEFLQGGFLEVRVYSMLEKLKMNKKDKIIALARERIGEAKYDILTNNCEHFVNECVFNKHISLEASKYQETQK